jgi:hypothetical protein
VCPPGEDLASNGSNGSPEYTTDVVGAQPYPFDARVRGLYVALAPCQPPSSGLGCAVPGSCMASRLSDAVDDALRRELDAEPEIRTQTLSRSIMARVSIYFARA